MWRLLWGMILSALILVALSESVRKDLVPYLERATKLVTDVLDRVGAASGVQELGGSHEADSSDKREIAPEPSSSVPHSRMGEAEVEEESRETAQRDMPDREAPPFRREARATQAEEKGPTGSESFPDFYEKARTSLLRAVEILEGRGDARE